MFTEQFFGHNDNNNSADTHDEQQASSVDTELQACKTQLKEVQQKYAYLGADFENYKRRISADRAQVTLTAQAELLRKLLPVIDGIERAYGSQPTTELPEQLQSWVKGIGLVQHSFNTFLQAIGVEIIPADGTFDPELHEALSQVETDTVPSGKIVEVLQKGYTFKGVVLRHSLVNVAR